MPIRHSGSRPSIAAPARWFRSRWLWAGFATAAIATFVGVAWLDHTMQRELHEQGERTKRQERVAALARITEASHALKHQTMATLASFHLEGLSHALRKWDEGSAPVTGVFQWQPQRGFLPDTAFPSGLEPAALPTLWQSFRSAQTGRTLDPATASTTIAFRTTHVRLLDNPDFSARDLGYQAENLDILAYAGQPVDPWAGWAAHDVPSSPWIFWYQPGPAAAVRGCFVDPSKLVAALRESLRDRSLARLELVEKAPSSASTSIELTDIPALPGFALAAQPGDLFADKQSHARFLTVIVTVLLAVFLVCAAILALVSRAEFRDAERKTTFVTQVSHELRTPLTSIRMFAEMLGGDDVASDKRARYAAMITRESERLSHLIERLLSFNALERGEPPRELATFDLAAVARETIEEMDHIAADAGMALRGDLPRHPLSVRGDRAAAKQALINLIENAVKYAREGKSIEVTLSTSDGSARLGVCDAGPGIPAHLGERAFEPFVQGGRTLTDKAPGIGLGLSIARGLLRDAGGDLVLLPSARGACFEIRLPLAAAA